MHLQYGKVEFEILSITDYNRQQVFTDDGTTYLFDHITIRCHAYLNTDATRVDRRNNANNQMPWSDGSAPATAVNLVRELIVPRQKLYIWSYQDDGAGGHEEVILLQSPKDGSERDARSGPICKVHSLDVAHGYPTIVCDLEFETDLCPFEEASLNTNIANFVLANRWTWRTQYNELYAETRIIEGSAVVRMDNLEALGLVSIDTIRAWLVPPIPAGFKRLPPVFEMGSLGNTLDYTVIDEQQPMSMPKALENKIANIDVVSNRMYNIGRDWSKWLD